ncbi:MAG: glycosyltransferase family 2 protein [Deltaproteobacteria bacterium]|nr:glycosyltransferase family 2 protein [Deltaproteobacteria bacterium]
MKETLVSIVLLTKNAGKEFVKTLEAISRQDVDFPFEIIVLDSGSTDGTLELSGKYDARIYRIPPAEFNFGLTRNHGFSLASGDFIVTISQDVVPFDKSWLEKMVSPFLTDKNVVAVQGKTVVPGKSEVFYWEKKGFFYFTSESRNWIEKYKCGLSFVNCAVRRDFWEKHQLGSIPFSEDKVFQKMIHDSGMDIYVAKDAICFHGHQYSFKSLIDRLKNEGVGWRTAGVRYGLKDCLSDIYDNKWMIRNGFGGWMKGEIQTTQELLFPILRPVCICWGNSKPI